MEKLSLTAFFPAYNDQHTIESIDEALKMLRYQRDTWALLMEKIGKEKASNAAKKLDLPEPSSQMEAAFSVQG